MLFSNRPLLNFTNHLSTLNFRKLLSEAGVSLLGFVKFLLLLLVGSYRTLGNLFMGGACRFEPSCSEYALEALKKFHVLMALKLIILRVYRCRPGGAYGFDPVPLSKSLMGCSKQKDCRGHHGTT
jgi:uncharacterized protein